MSIKYGFEWDPEKEWINISKHGVDFITAARVLEDPRRKIIVDSKNSKIENRLFCLGKVDGKIVTVRFTYRGESIRIIGAGFWRGGRKNYAK
ncbi:MAG: BrnT family toxin [Candidatus Tantalella remota]|nr:BrnT family toxin [Candidatus Tantalella remota]